MEFYPIIVLKKAIDDCKAEINEVELTSKDSNYISACKYVNESRIFALKATIRYLESLDSIPILPNDKEK